MPPVLNLDPLCTNIACWAVGKPLVRRVWLFGSRVRQDYRPDSDLDIAVELDIAAADGSDESGGVATWMFESEGWKEQLQALSQYEVQLEHFLEGQTPTIKSALERSSRLVYKKSQTQR